MDIKEKNYTSDSSSIDDEYLDPKRMTQDEQTALVLCSWKTVVLDPQAALELEEDKRLVLGKHGIQYPPAPPPPPPPQSPLLPPVAALNGLVGECSHPFEKQLTESDLKKDQTRLLLKQDHVNEYLYPLLRSMEVEEIKKNGMLVNVYDEKGRMYEMVFKLWGLKAYVLTSKNWLNFCNDHKLVKEQDWVTIWMFRHNHRNRLCFLITSQRRYLPSAAAVPLDKKKKKRIIGNGGRKRRRRNDDDV